MQSKVLPLLPSWRTTRFKAIAAAALMASPRDALATPIKDWVWGGQARSQERTSTGADNPEG